MFLVLVPNSTNTSVAINTVNQNINTEYFVDNDSLSVYPGIEMDGFTKKLTTAPGSTTAGSNVLKIAVADVADSSYDSWVLLEAGSITCEVVEDDCQRSSKSSKSTKSTKCPKQRSTKTTKSPKASERRYMRRAN